MTVVAVNTATWASLDDWVTFWRSKEAGDVIWATDSDLSVARGFEVMFLGTTIIIDRQGHISYRDGGATSYETLKAEIENVL